MTERKCQIPNLEREEEWSNNKIEGQQVPQGGNQASLLGEVTRELSLIEKEKPGRLEHILKNQSGVSDLDIGNQIVELLRNAV